MSVLHRLVQLWTHLYTFALPPAIRDRRRAEIESDVWESEHDPDLSRRRLAFRVLRGMPADMCWRLEVTPVPQRARVAASALAMAAMLAVALWASVRLPGPPHAAKVLPKRLYRINLGSMPPPPPRRLATPGS